jgi:hypothetical protein
MDLVWVLVVLQDVEAKAAWFVVVGASGVVHHGRHESFLVVGLNLDSDYQSDHDVSSAELSNINTSFAGNT